MPSNSHAELAEELRACKLKLQRRDKTIENLETRIQHLETENSNLKYQRKGLEETISLLSDQIETFERRGLHSSGIVRSSAESNSASSGDAVGKKALKQLAKSDGADTDNASEKTSMISEVVNFQGLHPGSPFPFSCEALGAAEQKHALESVVPAARAHVQDVESASIPESHDPDFRALEKMAIREDHEDGADEHNLLTFQETGKELALQPRPSGRFSGSELKEVGTGMLQQSNLPPSSGLIQQPPAGLPSALSPAVHLDPATATQPGTEGTFLNIDLPIVWPREIKSVKHLIEKFPHLARRLCVFIHRLPLELCKTPACAHKFVEEKTGVTLAAESLQSRKTCSLTVGCKTEQDAKAVRECLPYSNFWVPMEEHKAATSFKEDTDCNGAWPGPVTQATSFGEDSMGGPEQCSQSDLAEKVRQFQSQCPPANKLWHEYCDRIGNIRMKDPARHTSDFIEIFLDELKDQLAQMVKSEKIVNPSYKKAWAAYCNKYGNGTLDPKLHTAKFISSFMNQSNLTRHWKQEPSSCSDSRDQGQGWDSWDTQDQGRGWSSWDEVTSASKSDDGALMLAAGAARWIEAKSSQDYSEFHVPYQPVDLYVSQHSR